MEKLTFREDRAVDYIIGVLAFIAITSLGVFLFLIFVISWIRLSIRNRVKALGYQGIHGYNPKGILQQSHNQSREEAKFFKLGDWPDIKDPKIASDLKKQYRLARIERFALILFAIGYIGVMGLNTIIHFYF